MGNAVGNAAGNAEGIAEGNAEGIAVGNLMRLVTSHTQLQLAVLSLNDGQMRWRRQQHPCLWRVVRTADLEARHCNYIKPIANKSIVQMDSIRAVSERLQLMKQAAAVLGANMQQRQKLACSETINKARCGSCTTLFTADTQP